MANNSFRSQHLSDDIRASSLASIIIWSSDETYKIWCISLVYQNSIRGMVCTQLRLDANALLYNPVCYRDPSMQGATTTSFNSSPGFYTSDRARQIFTTPFVTSVNGVLPTFSDVYGVLCATIPGYQLPPDNHGSQGWAVTVLEALMNRGYVAANTMTVFNQRVYSLKASSAVARAAIPNPIPRGIIY